MDPSYNELSRDHKNMNCAFPLTSKVGQKIRQLKFSQFCISFLYYLCFAPDPISVIAFDFSIKVFLFILLFDFWKVKFDKWYHEITCKNENV